MATFIPPDKIELIKDRSDLLEVVQHYHPELKKSGASYKGKCPQCGSGDSFTVSPGKGFVKCFACHKGKKGALGYLMEFQGMDFSEACLTLADRYSIDITPSSADMPAPAVQTSKKRAAYSEFRDEQLQASGIPETAQQYTITHKDEEIIRNRYDSGTIDHMGIIQPGYDMLLHYLDLDGKPIMYRHEKTKKSVPFIRIRHENPDDHKDKDGRSIKYKTPTKAGNHLWLPEYIRTAYREKQKLPALAFIEGEKKADALCLAGIPAVGIAGIWNFSTDNEMPGEIERLIRTCEIDKVIFFIDSDYDDLGRTIPSPIDLRPSGFFQATLNFRDYFENYRSEGLNIYMYLAYGRDTQYKGMDDLLVALRDQQALDALPDLSEDLRRAMHGHKGGDHITATDITIMHPTKIRRIWHLDSPSGFRDHHKARLKELIEFVHGGIKYTYNAKQDAFEVKEKIEPEERFWKLYKKSNGEMTADFVYKPFMNFLHNRGYYQVEVSPERYRLVHKTGRILTAVDHRKVDRYVLDFIETLEEPAVEELYYRGFNQYISADRLTRLKSISPSFLKPTKDKQYMFFKDKYWEITAEKVTEHKYTSLAGDIWKDDIIDFSPEHIEDFLKMDVTTTDGKHDIKIECKHDTTSDIFRYFQYTSDIHHRTSERTTDQEALQKRLDTLFATLADKIIATGYILSGYKDPSVTKAIVCMDAFETENGRSEGGTGKSIYATMFEYVIKTMVLPAKNPKLTEDKHIYEGVDETTRLVVLDDCRRSFDFEAILSDITRGVTVNPKGLKKYFVGLMKFIITTNHTIRGDDRSYVRRQYTLGFSDFFNLERTPFSTFKRAMFVEWPHEQWNYFYNLMAYCLMMFMRYGLVTFAPSADIERKKQRDFIGEDLLAYLENFFHRGSPFINRRLDMADCIQYYLKDHQQARTFCTRDYMVKRLKKYCQYAGFIYNPDTKGERMRDGGKDKYYFIIADETYSAQLWKSFATETFEKMLMSDDTNHLHEKAPF